MAPAPDAATASRFGWRYVGKERPPFAVASKPKQESVWDYPRPPRLELDQREVVVRVGQTEVARSERSWRVLETASPPTFYLPPEDVRVELLKPSAGGSHCEWKGVAGYWQLKTPDGDREPVAWSYVDPLPAFEKLEGYFAFYAGRIECLVGGKRVVPQPGHFYGGWITLDHTGGRWTIQGRGGVRRMVSPGFRLGPYSVTAKIDEGGMGEVYRAQDTKLDRDVQGYNPTQASPAAQLLSTPGKGARDGRPDRLALQGSGEARRRWHGGRLQGPRYPS